MQKTKEIIVETGNLKIANNTSNIITRALGSCVALTLYDQVQKIGGMIHYILPENPGEKKEEKYADTGIHLLLGKILSSNARKENLVAKMIGGAIMFEDFIAKLTLLNIEKLNIYGKNKQHDLILLILIIFLSCISR